ncbi:hypothetical protein A2U01_0045954, partial [Trifolium medium]
MEHIRDDKGHPLLSLTSITVSLLDFGFASETQ